MNIFYFWTGELKLKVSTESTTKIVRRDIIELYIIIISKIWAYMARLDYSIQFNE